MESPNHIVTEGGPSTTTNEDVAAAGVAADASTPDGRDLDATIETYFTRYDLDASGTLNTVDEARQLLTNLVFKLELKCGHQDIEDLISEMDIQDGDPNCKWDLSTFTAWFKDHENQMRFMDSIGAGGDPRTLSKPS